MIRETSLQAYHQIKNEGLLARRHFQVYDALYDTGPCTANELHRYIQNSRTGQANDNVSTRLGELRDKGVVSEVGKRSCSVTDRTCLLWDVTPNLPIKLPKRLTNSEKIKRLKKAHMMLLKHVSPSIRAEAKAILTGER